MPTRRFLAAIAGLSVVLWSLLLLGGGAAFAQQASSSSPSFHERVKELASALQNSPRLKKLSEQQRLERVEFVVGNTLFTLLHEMGHVIIAEMKLPVLGREEDAADTYAALRMLRSAPVFRNTSLLKRQRIGF